MRYTKAIAEAATLAAYMTMFYMWHLLSPVPPLTTLALPWGNVVIFHRDISLLGDGKPVPSFDKAESVVDPINVAVDLIVPTTNSASADHEKEYRQLYVLRDSLAYCYNKTGDIILVRREFSTDLASIPIVFTPLFPPNGAYTPAAIVHDYLYALGEPGDETGRQYADMVFWAAMAEARVSLVDMVAVYSAVRMFGKNGYGRKADWKFYDTSVRYDEKLGFTRSMVPRNADPRPKDRIAGHAGKDCKGFYHWRLSAARTELKEAQRNTNSLLDLAAYPGLKTP